MPLAVFSHASIYADFVYRIHQQSNYVEYCSILCDPRSDQASALMTETIQNNYIHEAAEEPAKPNIDPSLIALFRLLTRQPPADHDFATCPICKRYGIESI